MTADSSDTQTEQQPGQQQGFARAVREQSEAEIDEHFRHIVCVLCYPEFVGTRQAPHDAVCICGKRVRAGDAPGPSTAPQCILCNEMLGGHFAVAHSGQDA